MARPRLPRVPPDWFDLRRYAAARSLDSAGWFTNLMLRIEAGKGEPAAGWRKALLRLLREEQPIWAPGHWSLRPTEALLRHTDADELEVPRSVDSALLGAIPFPGVYPLSVAAFYAFEKMLPERIREYGRDYVPDLFNPTRVPDGYTGPLHAAFEPQLLGQFVRVDLSQPDAVLLRDFELWLKGERQSLAAIPGVHPYREGLSKLAGRKAPKLRTFAKIGVLPLLDLQMWCAESGAKLSREFLAELLEIDKDTLRETQRYAALLSDYWVVMGWLGAAARAQKQAIERDSAEVSRPKLPS